MATDDETEGAAPHDEGRESYAVLARRYRPQTFDALIGQEFLVRVLTNAFARGKVPQAMILTGVRGVGKTTTARIVAKGLNCASVDAPTVAPCGVCATCKAIAASRHVDVLEMDAASRTGIDDIREIIDGVAYRAAEARYKVYIIDETHMLSKSAFNGLLKTLEEPPEHVVFILATTDIDKVPVTVLSRCMRFDLRRVSPERLTQHLSEICAKEGVAAEDDALRVIARAAEGSVRDALSLLDQAVAHAGPEGLQEAGLRQMLGMADRGAVFELFDAIMRGAAAEALRRLADMHAAGAEAQTILRDLGEACHLATMIKAAPARAEAGDLSEIERSAATAAAERYGVRALGRFWQMLLKALEEASIAPSPLAAAEMAVIRMSHVAELPTPGEIVERLAGAGSAAAPRGGGGAPASAQPSPPAVSASAPSSPPRAPTAGATGAPTAALATTAVVTTAVAAPVPTAAPSPRSFEEIVALVRAKRDAKLLIDIERHVRPGPVRDGAFTFAPADDAPAGLAAELGQKLSRWTGRRWIVSIEGDGSSGAASAADRAAADGDAAASAKPSAPPEPAPVPAPTLAETRAAAEAARRAEAMAHPIVQAVMTVFPGAAISEIRAREAAFAAPAGADDLFDPDAFDERLTAEGEAGDPLDGPPPFEPYDDEL